MAKRRRRIKKRKMNRGLKWTIIILVMLVALVGAYFGRHVYMRYRQQYEQQQTIEKQAKEKRDFIKKIAPEAQKMQTKYHVMSSITIAQAILESNWGKSSLAKDYHNLFGIKGSGANSKVMSTKEYTNGQWVTISGRFKVYSSWNASIADHTKLMLNGTYYNSNNYSAVVNATNYKDAAQALQDADYATDPDYAKKLINIIQTYDLDQYDN